MNNIKYAFIIVLIICYIFVLYFNRSPPINRVLCDNCIVSPAYGRIIDNQSDHECHLIKIMLDVFDVHVQYAPIDGYIEQVIHKPGLHCIVNQTKIATGKTLDNENIMYKITSHGQTVYVWQIAGKFARRCLPFVNPGDRVLRGDPLGRILLGSQVDIMINKQTLTCKVGDYLHGGLSILAVTKIE